jgi:2-phosphoglycolate phosphatase
MNLIEIDLVLFDLDGVLIDSSEDISYSVNRTLKEFGFDELEKREIVSFLGHGPKDLIDRAFGEQNNILKANALKYYKNFYYSNCTNKTFLFDDVKDFLKKISMKKKAVVTNKLENPSRKILEYLDILPDFDIIVGPDSIAKLKPNPEGILKVIDNLNIDNMKTLMIGDSDVDIIAGKTAGVYTCGVKNRFGNQENLVNSKPNFIVNNLNELFDYIK